MRESFFCLAVILALSLHQYAFAQVVDTESSEVQIEVPEKSGNPLIIQGIITGSDGKPVPGADIWIYHTDSQGYYARDDNGEEKGWRHSLYSAKLKSAEDGTFNVHTIKPAGYPNSINPAHLHLRINTPNYPELEYTAYFEGGNRITGDIKNLVKKYGTMFLLPIDISENGSQKVTWQIRLLKSSPY